MAALAPAAASCEALEPVRKTYLLKLAPVMASAAAGVTRKIFLYSVATGATARATALAGVPTRISQPSFSTASRARETPTSGLDSVSLTTIWISRPATLLVDLVA